MNPERFQPWASTATAVASAAFCVASLALGAASVHSLGSLAETGLVPAAYVGAAVGFGVHAAVTAQRIRQYTAGTRDAVSTGAGTDISFFCFMGAVVLTTVPNVDPSWRPLFFAPAALLVLLGIGGVVARNRRVRARLGWEIPE